MKMTSPNQRGKCLYVLCACGLFGAAAPGVVADQAPFAFRTGVVVDPVGGVFYAQTLEGFLACVDLQTGAERWRMSDELKPLVLVDGVLWAHAPADDLAVLQIAGIDLRERIGGISGGALSSGAIDTTTAPSIALRLEAQLPEGVAALLQDESHQRFHLSVVRTRGEIFLKWDYQKLTKARQVTVDTPPDARREEGVVRLTPAAARQALAATTLTTASVQDLQVAIREELPQSVTAALDMERLAPPVMRVGNVWAGVQRSSQGAHEVAMLKRWRTTDGAALPDVMLAQSPANFRYPSADERHLLVSGPAGGGDYAWQIIDAASAAVVVELEHDRPGAWFFLHGDLLLHESYVASEDGAAGSLMMRALDANSGDLRWQYAYRDTAYRGALPPARSTDATSGMVP